MVVVVVGMELIVAEAADVTGTPAVHCTEVDEMCDGRAEGFGCVSDNLPLDGRTSSSLPIRVGSYDSVIMTVKCSVGAGFPG